MTNSLKARPPVTTVASADASATSRRARPSTSMHCRNPAPRQRGAVPPRAVRPPRSDEEPAPSPTSIPRRAAAPRLPHRCADLLELPGPSHSARRHPRPGQHPQGPPPPRPNLPSRQRSRPRGWRQHVRRTAWRGIPPPIGMALATNRDSLSGRSTTTFLRCGSRMVRDPFRKSYPAEALTTAAGPHCELASASGANATSSSGIHRNNCAPRPP